MMKTVRQAIWGPVALKNYMLVFVGLEEYADLRGWVRIAYDMGYRHAPRSLT